MEKINKFVEDNKFILKNKYVTGIITILLISYTGLAAPKLPKYIEKIFDYNITKFIMFFMIVYMNNEDVKVSFVVALSVLLLLIILSSNTKNNKEHYNMEENKCKCDCQKQTTNGDYKNCDCNTECNLIKNNNNNYNYDDKENLFAILNSLGKNKLQIKDNTTIMTLFELTTEAQRRIKLYNKQLTEDEKKKICKDVLLEYKEKCVANGSCSVIIDELNNMGFSNPTGILDNNSTSINIPDINNINSNNPIGVPSINEIEAYEKRFDYSLI